MIRQTIGFNWGPSGVSTNVWKGVLLRDLLLDAGVTERDMVGKHVEFIGVEDLPNKVGPGPFKDEPWGKLVKYGTSVPLARAMNPAYDIIIAYEQNGERMQVCTHWFVSFDSNERLLNLFSYFWSPVSASLTTGIPFVSSFLDTLEAA